MGNWRISKERVGDLVQREKIIYYLKGNLNKMLLQKVALVIKFCNTLVITL